MNTVTMKILKTTFTSTRLFNRVVFNQIVDYVKQEIYLPYQHKRSDDQ